MVPFPDCSSVEALFLGYAGTAVLFPACSDEVALDQVGFYQEIALAEVPLEHWKAHHASEIEDRVVVVDHSPLACSGLPEVHAGPQEIFSSFRIENSSNRHRPVCGLSNFGGLVSDYLIREVHALVGL